jgi:hypothetical protein
MSSISGTISGIKRRERIHNDPYHYHHLLFRRVTGDIDGCWNFTGCKDKLGYGKVNIKGQYLAHRAAFLIVNGWIPHDKLICHKCDNPSCINPSHLFVGTDLDNTLDAMKKGRKFIPDNHLHRWKNHEPRTTTN